MEYFYLAAAFVLVLANGFFVATEFAIVKVRPTRLQALVEEGRPGAQHALKMVQRLDSYLSACQFGITLASLGLGWLGEPAFARVIEPLVMKLLPDGETARSVSHTAGIVLSFAAITILHIVVGELAPKSMAIQKAERVSSATALPMRAFFAISYPGVWLLNALSSGFLKLVGMHPAGHLETAHDEEELRLILAQAAAAGSIEASRAELLERSLAMLEKTVRQVLVPRNQVHYLDVEEPMERNVAEARAAGHTWLPVCRGNLDRIEGVVNDKDLFFLLSRGELKSLAQVQRSVLFVPENATLEQLLSEFRKRRRQMAVVVDEHGGTSGIVSIADVVAEVVGEVAELGRKVEEVKTLPGGKLELPGSAQLGDLEERLDVKFDVESTEVTTVGGYLMAKLGRVPEVGDKVTVEDFEVRVEEMVGPRVERVRIQPVVALVQQAPVGPSGGS